MPDPTETPYALPLPEPIPHEEAARIAEELFDALCAPAGRARDSADDFRAGQVTAIVHMEGAEPIAPDLSNLERWYERGLRSIGLVWSRPNDFAEGVPFRFPSSPDTGPGLTAAGRELVRACNRLGILVDLSHLNEAGFWDVAALSDAPLVATHSNAHALCAASRNLTDAQLDAIRDSNGVVGVNFAVTFLREDGSLVPETPITEIVRHVDYLVERMGIDHVAFGSDFDGAVVPEELGGAAGLPKLVDALRAAGYDDDASRRSRTRTGCACSARRGAERERCLAPPESDPIAREEAARLEPQDEVAVLVEHLVRREDRPAPRVLRRRLHVGHRRAAGERVARADGRGPADLVDARRAERRGVEQHRRTNIPMKSAIVCQPLAIRPPNSDSVAASGSTWNGCGSKRVANSTISSSVTVIGPTSTTSPTWKSSQ